MKVMKVSLKRAMRRHFSLSICPALSPWCNFLHCIILKCLLFPVISLTLLETFKRCLCAFAFRISQRNLTVELFLLLHFIITAPATSSGDVDVARLLTLYIDKVSPESLNACKDFNINVISGLMDLQN